MGGRSKKQTVGYRYRIGLHLVLCQGPVDAVQEIQIGDRTAWGDASRASLPTGHGLGRVRIDRPTLFGGDEREGGVVGDLDVLPGDTAQGRNDYLMSLLGPAIPAFRGVLSVVARKILFAANNPYLKPWAVRVRRFTAGWHGDPWMPWDAEVRTWDADTGQAVTVGMNPAHILVQCLTDTHWGMGYPMSTLGASFWNAAWALSSEGSGVLATEPEGRLAAITDFTFNLGAGRLQTSTLRRRVNQRDWAAAAAELRRWVYGGGRVLPGLVARREAEARLLAHG